MMPHFALFVLTLHFGNGIMLASSKPIAAEACYKKLPAANSLWIYGPDSYFTCERVR